MIQFFLSGSAMLLLAGIVLSGTVITGVRRIWFSPLSKFPGPKLAALTLWYEFYFDFIKKGSFHWKIQDMHRKYGPIVRISPYEVHILDPDFWDELYCANRKLDRYDWWVKLIGAPGSAFGAVGHDLHRLRRAPLSSFFSARAVTQLEDQIMSKVEKLSARFLGLVETGEVFRFDAAFLALSMDIITEYAFAKDDKYLDKPDFEVIWKETLSGAARCSPLIIQFPWLVSLAQALPIALVSAINSHFGLYLRWKQVVREQVKPILAAGPGTTKPSGDGQSTRTIFHTILDSDLPPHEKTLDRLVDEGGILVFAGSDTTGQTLSRLFFYFKHEPQVLAKLREELDEAIPEADKIPTWTALQQLPYLSATVKEAIRMSYSTTARLPRVTQTDIEYEGYTIPAGTPTSQTPYLILTDASVFPEPEKFRPERWIEAGKELNKYFIAFNRGSRQCLGMNLAYAKLYLTIATIVRRFDWEMYETTLERDVVCNHGFMLAAPSLDSKGIRAKITARR
ncbi:benzoate 4-monooxygenase [Cladorrhinum samala]|uniref:Benzoate 4-monooxygenase n=1 Tax=Cladorrhinum samala TaxID=585594 RepID=A0AAV9I1B9_9PEZI|nr:benzoate 4-monooxygenase [Cladorrhinum samala]